MRTIRPARTAAGRRKQIARLAAEALAPPRPQPDDATPGRTSAGARAAEAPDVAAIVRTELARQRAAAERAADAAEVERFACPRGRGCWRCGLSHCATHDERGDLVPGWTIDGDRAECVFCASDGEAFGRVGDTPDDERVRFIARLLGVSLPLRALGDPRAFRLCPVWFVEHPDADPVIEVERRWAHVDRAALRTQWDRIAEGHDEPVPEPEIMRAERCSECGCSERFIDRHEEMPRVATGPGGSIRGSDWEDTHLVPIAGACVDCAARWYVTAGSPLPAWWIERRGKRLPRWARHLVERVPA